MQILLTYKSARRQPQIFSSTSQRTTKNDLRGSTSLNHTRLNGLHIPSSSLFVSSILRRAKKNSRSLFTLSTELKQKVYKNLIFHPLYRCDLRRGAQSRSPELRSAQTFE